MDIDPAHRVLLGRALATIEDLEARLRRAERDRAAPIAAPIAVVGVGCRLPGRIRGAAEFWRALRDGADLVGALDRRTAEAGASPGGYVTGLPGAYLDDVDRFDDEFFGIPPGEAAVMDPQQRLLLETAWDALEHAGMPRETVRGSVTGVFLTLGTHDYWQVGVSRLGTAPRHDHAVLNNSHSTACARMSHLLGVRGPSLTVDAGCSSALLATHLAARSLRTGECDAALVGAVNLMMAESSGAGIAEAGSLSPDGRCRTFDAGADGYGIGEGCGVVVLKRLADAERDGDRVLAVLSGSAVNHNGGGPGYGVPAVSAQREVIRAAYEDAGVPAWSATYVESHGTGTPMGDAAELRALAAELLPGRPADRPLVVGAVKTNVSHLFAASGVIGLIKTVLCLHHGEIPGNLHFTRPHPDLGPLPPAIVIPGAARQWPRGGERRVAGVSAFAAGGSNAHLVVTDPPAGAATGGGPAADDGLRPVLVPVSAHDEAASRALAAGLADLLERGGPGITPADVAYTAARRRSHHAHRGAVTGRTAGDLVTALRRLAEGRSGPAARAGRASVAVRTAWCLGAGADWPVMASLARGEPVRRLLAEAAPLVAAETGVDPAAADWAELAAAHRSGRPVLGPGGAPYDPAAARALTVLAQIALGSWWRSLTGEPALVLCTGLGVPAARHLVGGRSLEDTIKSVLADDGPDVGLPDEGGPSALRRYDDPAALAAAASGLARDGRHGVVEIGPVRVPPGPDPGADDPGTSVLDALGRLYCRGVDVRWDVLYPTGRHVDLPPYPWADRRHWWSPPPGGRDAKEPRE
ncbi:polyketide synthase [Microbispora cellulosiformans]|uniref:Polyketide synthase n=1 Tax=Microbispora cellulosiformans TaxID=2614688 RepID=A0A5J5K381_9ACTN|nr:polyketide synthase [Microbispora cellulosiformans]KAA9377580.1 polyketide synthase [Microbispora cellulosiformans]